MGGVFTFKLLSDSDEIGRVHNFLKDFPLDYPNYFDWLEKCRRELEIGYKKAICAMDSTGQIVGSLVFQPHKADRLALELKNLRVAPSFINRKVGTKMVTAAEIYARQNGFRKIQGDAHLDNPVLGFMLKRGYRIEAKESLYTEKLEAIIGKVI